MEQSTLKVLNVVLNATHTVGPSFDPKYLYVEAEQKNQLSCCLMPCANMCVMDLCYNLFSFSLEPNFWLWTLILSLASYMNLVLP